MVLDSTSHTGLFIPTPRGDSNFTLYPRDDTPFVIRATIQVDGMDGVDTLLTILEPAGLRGRFPGPERLHNPGSSSDPRWMQVDESYAGSPRLIDGDEYYRIYRAWWFAQGGHTYAQWQSIILRNGVCMKMGHLWRIFMDVRGLRVDGLPAYDALCAAVYGKPYDLSTLLTPRSRTAWLEKVLFSDGPGRQELTDFARAVMRNLIAPNGELVAPWPAQRII